MSLRTMHEEEKEIQKSDLEPVHLPDPGIPSASPEEWLGQMSFQDRLILENTLLKEALVKSADNCEKLMRESKERIDILNTVYAKQNEGIRNLKKANASLEESMKETLLYFKEEVLTTVSKEVSTAVEGNIEKIDQGTSNPVRRMEIFTDRLDTSANMMNRKRDELLEAGKAGLGMYKLNCFVNVVVVGWLIIKLIFFKHI